MTQEEALKLVAELGVLKSTLGAQSPAIGYSEERRANELCLCLLAVGKGIEEAIEDLANQVCALSLTTCQEKEGGMPTSNINGAAPSKSTSADIVPCAHRRVVMKTYYPYDPKDKRDHLHDFQCRDCGEDIPHESRRFIIAGERAEVGQ
jgi:hypothetical protein